ncbi:sigma-70 family RNA polymerase sigma factor [Geomobilimonas luticola]|uniref:Sigma-70 family RNA polymerase sigma factor n=1 Tax=Geomobilimonas luticola TaxID=1114878 RepID=A0ABS5SB92_9BACT|nr:sigma-70 family RNA polymerase sigma factor [Geomobilimonas luticola]MBT0652648.1 sigma-70 family RNA polymerase sigma factor [Geomobilimonas luticola]
MDFFKAMQWVQDNEPTIKSKIRQYRKFTPYEMCDFQQEAYEAAFVAVLRSQEKNIPFEAAFWTTFRNKISVLTPDPNFTHGSNSIPSHICYGDIEAVEQTIHGSDDGADIEAIFEAISHHLTEKERETLSLSLGVADQGKLSTYEIADLYGCSDFNVRDTLKRAFRRIKQLADNGTIVVDRMRLVTQQHQEIMSGCVAIQDFTPLGFSARSPPS